MLSPGRILNQAYRIEEKLGAGGLATVYRAVHVRTGMAVAVKVLHPFAAADPAMRERFAREAYAANVVDHPGVVRVLADGLDEGVAYLVMELVAGPSLKQHWSSAGRKLPLASVGWIIRELLVILAAAHQKGVIHRDIKPDNILLELRGTVRLADFGIARILSTKEHMTRTGSALGTPAFMSPEQAYAKWSEVDARSDVFAVAATAWTLLTGTFVHRGDTVPELIVSACTRPVEPIGARAPELPKGLARVIDRGLSYERDARFANAGEMLRAWSEATGSVGPSATAASGPRRSFIGRRAMLIGGGSLLAAAGAATAAVLATRPPPRRTKARPSTSSDARAPAATSSVSPEMRSPSADAPDCSDALSGMERFVALGRSVLGGDLSATFLTLQPGGFGDIGAVKGSELHYYHCAVPQCSFESTLRMAYWGTPHFVLADIPWKPFAGARAEARALFAKTWSAQGQIAAEQISKYGQTLLFAFAIMHAQKKETYTFDAAGRRFG